MILLTCHVFVLIYWLNCIEPCTQLLPLVDVLWKLFSIWMIGLVCSKFTALITLAYLIWLIITKLSDKLYFYVIIGEDEAFVENARLDTGSREVFRHDKLKDKVKLSRVRNHFICKYSGIWINSWSLFVLVELPLY